MRILQILSGAADVIPETVLEFGWSFSHCFAWLGQAAQAIKASNFTDALVVSICRAAMADLFKPLLTMTTTLTHAQCDQTNTRHGSLIDVKDRIENGCPYPVRMEMLN